MLYQISVTVGESWHIRPTDKLLYPVRELGICRKFEARVQDSHLANFFKGSRVVTQLIQQNAQRPNVTLLIDGLFTVDVDHFRATVLECGVPLYIVLDQPPFCRRLGSRSWWSCGAKITELVYPTGANRSYQDVLDLEVAVQQGRPQIMHGCNALGHVGEDVQNLWLGKSMLQAGIHEVDQATAGAVLHEQEDLVAPTLQLRGMRVDVGHNVAMTFELLHGLHLCSHVGQGVLVRDRNPLQHADVWQAFIALGYAHQVDVRKSALGQVSVDGDAMIADLDLGARGKGAGWRVGSGRRRSVGLLLRYRCGG